MAISSSRGHVPAKFRDERVIEITHSFKAKALGLHILSQQIGIKELPFLLVPDQHFLKTESILEQINLGKRRIDIW